MAALVTATRGEEIDADNGGTTAKLARRVNDSPIVGAGTFADNRTCAVSATGDGEAFLRLSAAHEIGARMRLCGDTLAQAADHVVQTELKTINGTGALIAIDNLGHVVTPFNCEGMYRGLAGEAISRRTDIY